jgi:hypothetical protein
MIKMILRRLFPRRYGNIVAPLSHIADELLALQEQNVEDNRLDTAVIEKLNVQISARDVENSQASATRSKILSLLSH